MIHSTDFIEIAALFNYQNTHPTPKKNLSLNVDNDLLTKLNLKNYCNFNTGSY